MAHICTDMQAHSNSRLTPPIAAHPLSSHSLLYLPIPLFTYLENQLFLLVVQIPIHSCPWFAIDCSPLAAPPTPRHPTDQVTYLHRQHQQHQPSRLIQYCSIECCEGLLPPYTLARIYRIKFSDCGRGG